MVSVIPRVVYLFSANINLSSATVDVYLVHSVPIQIHKSQQCLDFYQNAFIQISLFYTSNYTMTTLHSSIQKFHKVNFIKILLERGNDRDINVRNLEGEMPLHSAVKHKKFSVELIDLLLKYGADVKATTPRDGNTALHWLFITQYDAMKIDIRMAVESLLKYGSDVNAVNIKGETPLHLVVRKKELCNFQLIRLLLTHGADVSIKDAIGENAYQAIVKRDCHHLVLVLIPANEWHERKISPFHVACLLHEFESVHKMLKLGADVNATDIFDRTPLYYAFVASNTAGKSSTLKLLLDYGADIKKALFNDTRISLYPTYLLIYDEMVIYIYQHQAKLLKLNEKQIERGIKVEFPSVMELEEHLRNSFSYLYFFDTGKNAEDYRNWLSCCSEEIKSMNETKIGNSTVSFLDLLLASAEMMTSYAKNKKLVKAFQTKKAMFPMYEGMLDANFDRYLKRRELIEEAAVVLSDVLKFADPTDIFYEKTLSYCSNKDLLLIIDEKYEAANYI